jgi:nicotinamidase-related amidase
MFMRGAFDKTSLPGQGSTRAALIIDLQNADGMGREDADAFYTHMSDEIAALRASATKIIWVTMGPEDRLHKPEMKINPYSREEYFNMGFRSFFNIERTDAFETFLKQSGPRRNETLWQKSERSALEPVSGKESLIDHLRENGTTTVRLYGAVSNHCIAETARTAMGEGLSVEIDTQSCLSWAEDGLMNPREGTLIWGGKENAAFHERRIAEALEVDTLPQSHIGQKAGMQNKGLSL